ncbi:putative ubiquitin-conjugating enzyme E2 18 [Asimina triloba]
MNERRKKASEEEEEDGVPNPISALSKIACNRLQKELVEWQVNPPSGFKHKVTDNLQRWIIEVSGAPGTLYANESYQLQVDFPEHYPMEAPQVRKTKIPLFL